MFLNFKIGDVVVVCYNDTNTKYLIRIIDKIPNSKELTGIILYNFKGIYRTKSTGKGSNFFYYDEIRKPTDDEINEIMIGEL